MLFLISIQMDLTTTDGPDAMDGFADAPEQAAEIFARYIHDGWGVGHAAGTAGGTTGVLIFLSIEDRTVYFSRGLALERVLRDTRVDAVIETMKPFLRQKQYDQAVLAAIAELDMYLAAGPELDWEEWFANWFGTIVVFGMFGGFGICIYKDILDRRHYARVSTQLSDLDRARAEALQGTFKATSCPICLENFKKKECTVVHEHESEGEEAETAAASSEESTPLVDSEIDPTTAGDESSTDDELVGSDGLALKLLRCGHTFDETCWQEWISSGNSHSIHRCPICQQDVGEEQPDSTTSPLTVDPLSIPRGGHNDSDDNGQTMVRQQDVQINTTNYNAEHENGGSAEEIRRQLRSLAMRQYTTERNFRLLRLAARYPQYIQRNELQRWTQVSYNGSLAQEAQLARQAAETAKHSTSSWGNTSSSSGFGGGFSSGGRGGRW